MKYTTLFQKQPPMRKVVYCLFLPLFASVYYFGWRSLAVVVVSVAVSAVTEWLFVRGSKGKISEAVFVTGMLYGLILPPTIPFYMVVLGAVFGITFGKMAFGGFGANVFNPAMVGRAFVYITFPLHLTNRWVPAANFSDFPGGFACWRFTPLDDYISAITTATPGSAFTEGAATLPSYLQLFIGNINGQFEKLGETMLIGGGSLGETSALLLIIGGLYLVYKKIANWRLVTGFFATYFIFQTIIHFIVPTKAPDPLFALLSGGAVLGGFYMVTDPVSATKTNLGKWIYAGLIAVLTVLIRTFSLFAGGLMFSILLGNMFGPIIEYGIKSYKKRGSKA